MSEQLVKNTFNQWIYIDSNDYIGKKIKNHGLYDSSSINFMCSLLEKTNTPVVMDIGANIGNHLLPILPIVKKAIAFEPQPEIFDKLQRSINKNKFTNCIVKNYGLGDKEEYLTFYENMSGNNGASSFVEEELNGKKKKTSSLLIKNGDAVLDDLKIQKLDFIKIDVEGFEFEVFKGIKTNIKKHSPMILMEWYTHTTGKAFLENNVFENILTDYNVIALEESYPWWVRNRFWSIRGMVDRSIISEYKLVKFNKDQDYNNILLFKKQHQEIVDKFMNSNRR